MFCFCLISYNVLQVFDSSSSLELSVDAAPPPPPSSATVKTKRGRGGADDVQVLPRNYVAALMFLTTRQDEQPKFHEMSLSLTIPDATSPCRLKMHLTFDNRFLFPFFAAPFRQSFVSYTRLRVASVVVCDSVDDRYE
jgi:hypothetical protein